MMRTQVLMRVKQRIVKKNQVMKKSPVIPVMKNQYYAASFIHDAMCHAIHIYRHISVVPYIVS